jgi:hypothetical protein
VDDLVGQPADLIRPVARADAEQDEQPAADLADGFAGHDHPARPDSLDDGTHLFGIDPGCG